VEDAVRTLAAAPIVAAMLAAAIGCSPGPMSKPVNATPMNKPIALGSDPASGALESVRQRFFGTWDLIALEAVPPGGGPRATVTASGMLTYDEFGNLMIDAHTTDTDAPVAAREVSMVSFKGRAVIDVPNSELKLMALTGNVDPNEVLSPERRRKYEFNNDTLKLSSFDEHGTVTAISTWRRHP
jgi:hypothetical protein